MIGGAILLVLIALPLTSGRRADAAQQPRDTVGIRLVDAPTSRADDPRSRIYIVDHVSPGTTISRRIEVSNRTAQPTHLELYAGGAVVDGGGFRFLEGAGGNDLATWTAVTPAEVDLRPGADAFATVTIAVPSEASAGERYAVVWAELPPSQPAGGGVSVVNRVGVRIYLSVGPGGEPATDFVIESLRPARTASDEPAVLALVRNTGGRALDLGGELTLSSGPRRLSAGPFQAIGTTVAPGSAADVPIPVDPGVPAGPWDARIVLRSGRVERAATATITFPEASGQAGQPVPVLPSAVALDAPSRSRSPELAAFAGAGLAAVGLALLFLIRRRRRRDRPPESQPEQTSAPSPPRNPPAERASPPGSSFDSRPPSPRTRRAG